MKTKDLTDPEFDETVGRELRDLLSVDPAPGFKARVKARVDSEPQPRAWSFPAIFAAAGVIAALIAAVVVFQPRGREIPRKISNVQQRPVRTEAPLPMVASSQRELPLPHRRVSKAARPEPQLIIAPNEASALRRLLSGEVKELPSPFEPQVREFHIRETVVEPLEPPAPIAPAPIAIAPLELPEPAVPDLRR
jgi:hypothetical protein